MIAWLVLISVLLASPAYAIQVAVGTYTGDGNATQDIVTSPACQPRVVFVKRDTAANNLFVRIDTMASTTSKSVTDAATETTAGITTFNANGFRVVTGQLNSAGATYYYATICDNGANDIATNTWTGDGTDNQNVTLSPNTFSPELVVIVGASTGVNYWRGATSHTGDSAAELNALDSNSPNAIQSFSTGSFQKGTLTNANTVKYYSFALKASAGVATGLFTGNGTDNRQITAIANPKMVLMKGDSLTRLPAYRFDIAGDASWGGTDASAADLIQTLNSTGFIVGTSTYVNENTVPMLWFAITDFASSSSGPLRRRVQ